MSDLAALLENAPFDKHASLLHRAWLTVNPAPVRNTDAYWTWREDAASLMTLLAARAFESVAIQLVPNGRDWRMMTYNGAGLSGLRQGNTFQTIRAATPALALASAAIRAHEEGTHP